MRCTSCSDIKLFVAIVLIPSSCTEERLGNVLHELLHFANASACRDGIARTGRLLYLGTYAIEPTSQRRLPNSRKQQHG
jgi:hypothetical protein